MAERQLRNIAPFNTGEQASLCCRNRTRTYEEARSWRIDWRFLPIATIPTRSRRRSPGSRQPGSQVSSCRRSEEHTSELQSLLRNSYAVFCLNNKKKKNN